MAILNVNEVIGMLTPAGAEQIYRNMQPKPVVQSLMYVGILALLGFIGALIGSLAFGGAYGIGAGVLYGVIGLITTLVVFFITGFLFSMLSAGIVKRQVSQEESLTLLSYAMTPSLLIGFLVSLLSPFGVGLMGGFSFGGLAAVGVALGLVALIYTLFMLYLGCKIRFGNELAAVATVFFIILFIVVGLVVGLIMAAITAAIYRPSFGGLGVIGSGSNCVTYQGHTYCV